jgi:hypothetical protein
VLPAKVLQRIRQPTVALRASTLGDAIGIGWFLREVDGVSTVGHGGSEVRRSVSGQRILYWSTGASDRLGGWPGGSCRWLPVQTVGDDGAACLVADLLYALSVGHYGAVSSWSCSSRSFRKSNGVNSREALDVYEAAQRERARAGSDQASRDDEVVSG